MTLGQLLRPLTARPEVGLGIAAFAGVALAAGLIPLPSFRRAAPAPAPAPPNPAGRPVQGGDVSTPAPAAGAQILSDSSLGWGGF